MDKEMGFPFGASFFFPSKGFEDDLLSMKKLGFNVARIEWPRNGFWETIERTPGKYDFSALDQAIKAAENVGVKLALQIGIFPPRWLRSEFGDEGVVNDRGLSLPSGQRNSVCYDNPEIVTRAKALIEKTVLRYRDSNGLYGWIAWNEPGLAWNDITCYCRYTRTRFQEWLKQKYGGVEALSEAWADYSQWSDWTEIEPPHMLQGFGSYTAWQDWRSFIDENYAALVRWVSEEIKKLDPKHPTKVNLAGALANVTSFGINHWKMAETADEFGTSVFVITSYGDYPHLVAHNIDLVRSCAKAYNKTCWVDEIQGGPNYCTHKRAQGMSPERVALWAWQSIARGAKGFTYWMWRPRVADWEGGEYGLVGKDGSTIPRTLKASKVAEIVRGNSDLLESSFPKPEVAVLQSTAIQHIMFAEGLAQNRLYPGLTAAGIKSYYRDSLMGAYKMLWELKITCDFVNPGTIKERGLDEYRALILPYPYLLNKEVAHVIKEFVQSGGFVVTEFPSIMKDENGHVYEQVPGANLWSTFGCRETDFGHVEDNELISGKIDNLSFEFSAFRYRQSLEITGEKAKVIARFISDGSPAIVLQKSGQGGTLLIATCFFSRYLIHDSADVSRFFWYWLKRAAGVSPELELIGLPRSLDRNVEVGLLYGNDTGLVIVINHNPVTVKFGLRSETMSKFLNLITGQEIELDNTAQSPGLQFSLDPLGALVMKTMKAAGRR